MASGEDYTIYINTPAYVALYIGGAGDLKVMTAGGDIVTLVGVLAGMFIPMNVKRVYATGTTATSILALA
jgi:hypothetical protein